jgi:hypothetical protein
MAQIQIPNFDEVSVSAPKLDPGEYVANIDDKPELKENQNGKPYLEIKLKIIEGPQQAQPDPGTGSTDPAGRTIYDRLYMVDGAYFRVKQLLISAGILARDDKESPLARGEFNSDILAGARLPIKVSAQMNNGKEYRNVDYIIA